MSNIFSSVQKKKKEKKELLKHPVYSLEALFDCVLVRKIVCVSHISP